MIRAIVAGGMLAGLGLMVWLARRLGRASLARDFARHQAEVEHAQLDEAVDAPRDTGSVVERLRDGGFGLLIPVSV